MNGEKKIIWNQTIVTGVKYYLGSHLEGVI
jgi:hypothetical protein